MPDLNGLEATGHIRKQLPKTRVLILSQHESPHLVTAAADAGASAYVTKSQAAHNLISVLDAALAGEPFRQTRED
jgi:DNA-binding NarL/FixJ family response regulator